MEIGTVIDAQQRKQYTSRVTVADVTSAKQADLKKYALRSTNTV
jgi:hypothetical protein